MVRPASILMVLTALLCLAPGARSQRTWVVGNGCGLPTDGFDLQDIIDQAEDGDTILVCNITAFQGAAPKIIGKSLTLVRLGTVTLGLNHQANKRTRIANLEPGQSVVLRGFDMWGGLVINNCAGPVWIEDCDFNAGPSTSSPGIDVLDSSAVTVIDSTFHGANLGDYLNTPGAGLRADDSRVYAYGSSFEGGNGWDLEATDGGHGLILDGAGLVLLDDCVLVGGEGGDTIHANCAAAGEGGHGARLDSVFASLWHVDSEFVPGISGVSSVAGFECTPWTNTAMAGPGQIHLLDLGGPSRGARLDALLANGETGSLTLDVQPTDQVFLLVGLDSAPLSLPGFDGAILPSPIVDVIALGVGAPSSIPVSIPANSLPAGLAARLAVQVVVLDGGDKRSGAGSMTTLFGGP